MKRRFCPVSFFPVIACFAFCLGPNAFLLSDFRDVFRLGPKQEEGYVWQGGQNQAYGKATRNPTADRSLDNGTTAACAASTVDRTGI
jgi:hypothetical protein